jgi:hypothetical protein
MILSVVLDTKVPPILPASSAEPGYSDSFTAEAGYLIMHEGDTLTISHPKALDFIQVPWSRVRHVRAIKDMKFVVPAGPEVKQATTQPIKAKR